MGSPSNIVSVLSNYRYTKGQQNENWLGVKHRLDRENIVSGTSQVTGAVALSSVMCTGIHESRIAGGV